VTLHPDEQARELAWRIKGYPNRCAICSFQLAESADKGCVIGNCSYRPHDGSAEDGRVSRNRAELAEIQGIIIAELAALLVRVRLAEAEWWKHQTMTTWHIKTCGCEECKRIARLRQAAGEDMK